MSAPGHMVAHTDRAQKTRNSYLVDVVFSMRDCYLNQNGVPVLLSAVVVTLKLGGSFGQKLTE